MKKLVCILLSLILAASTMTSCTQSTPPVDNTPTPPAETPDDNKPEEKPEPEVDMGIWHQGYIGSRDNLSYPEAINENEKTYVYSDVIVLAKPGTKASFTAANVAKDVYDTYSVSLWMRDGDSWVINPDGVGLGGNSSLVVTDNGDGTTTYAYVATGEWEYIRFCYRAGNRDFMDVTYPDVTVEETDEPGTTASILETKNWCISDRARADYSVLYGKTINFIGDSLFAGNSVGEYLVWPALLGMKYNMSWHNYGISGCTLSACENGKNAIISRYQKMADNDPDVIVFEGGRNDYNKCAELGNAADGDVTTYRGAVAELIKGLREKYPNAVIIAVTFWKANDRLNDAGTNCNVYTDAMKEVCTEMGVPYIDATDEDASGIRMTDKSFREVYSMKSSDVCHLNAEGMRLALQFFEAEIARIYSEATAEK